MNDLIDLDRARQNLPQAVNADEPAICTLVTAASKAIQKYCRRDFVATAYDELYDGGGNYLVLKNYPVISVESVRSDPTTVLQIRNTSSSNQQARVAVTASGLTFKRVAGGVATTDSLTFAANATVSAIATAINALGNGWEATVAGDYGGWPSADLRALQGALNAAGVYAGLKIQVREVSAFDVDTDHGWLFRSDFDHVPWSPGRNHYRVQYTAGYATIPEDVQEACAELTATWFQQRGRDLSFGSEGTPGNYWYRVQPVGQRLPERIRALLAPYRSFRV